MKKLELSDVGLKRLGRLMVGIVVFRLFITVVFKLPPTSYYNYILNIVFIALSLFLLYQVLLRRQSIRMKNFLHMVFLLLFSLIMVKGYEYFIAKPRIQEIMSRTRNK
jgi:hypothetical protein